MKKLAIILAIIIIILCNKENKNNIIIPEDSIRVRIIANSNSLEDQLIKVKIKENVEKEITKTLENVKDIKTARNKIQNNLNNIDNIVSNIIPKQDYTINYGIHYFPEKELFGVTYKEGNYESLIVKLGEAKGNNWWCVLFPPLCTIDVKLTEETTNIEYKSKVLEILNKYN